MNTICFVVKHVLLIVKLKDMGHEKPQECHKLLNFIFYLYTVTQ